MKKLLSVLVYEGRLAKEAVHHTVTKGSVVKMKSSLGSNGVGAKVHPDEQHNKERVEYLFI